MKTIYVKISALIIFAAVSINVASAQKIQKVNHTIKEYSKTDILHKGNPRINLSDFRAVKLDLNALKEGLKSVSYESERKSGAVAELSLPHPDGTLHTYQVVRNRTMHPELAAKYPQIATYNAYGVSHKEEHGKLDITPSGFHAMIFSPKQSTIFIDPYTKENTDDYVVYSRANLEGNKEFECSVSEMHIGESETESTGIMPFGSCELRTYRLALACTGEYANFHGSNTSNNDKSFALAAQVTTMNRVNGIYERTLAITMEIIPNNDLLIFLNPSTDNYTNSNGGTLLGQNQDKCDDLIGTANYDIGHVFSTGGGGIASLASVCSSSRKAQGVTGSPEPEGDPFDVDYVAHEMGHQFAGNHTQNNSCQRNSATSMEPGSGSTIMGYAGICSPNVQNNSHDNFHGISIQEISNFITSGGHTCPVKTPLANNPPVITSTTGNITIPFSTPFSLTATATDSDSGDELLYQWDQMNKEISVQPPESTSTDGPNFRSYSPSNDPTRFFPKFSTVLSGGTALWEVLPSVSRTMKFRLIVTDNHPIGSCNDHKDITVTFSNSGPFVVLYPSDKDIVWFRTTAEKVIWDVAGTDVSPVNCENVDILLSLDAGNTFNQVLATNVPNNGEFNLTVPNSPSKLAKVMVRCSSKPFYNISTNNFEISENTMSAEELKSNNVKIYPNPTNGIVMISLQEVKPTTIRITDVTGKLIFENTITEQQTKVNLSNYNSGIYFIQLTDDQDSKVVKLVKE
jgi:hypothetical protein